MHGAVFALENQNQGTLGERIRVLLHPSGSEWREYLGGKHSGHAPESPGPDLIPLGFWWSPVRLQVSS